MAAKVPRWVLVLQEAEDLPIDWLYGRLMAVSSGYKSGTSNTVARQWP